MVWGLLDPSGLGDFFPDGDYLGWEEKLKDYFDNQMPAEMKAKLQHPTSYAHYVANKWTLQRGTERPGHPPITALEDHEKPAWFETTRRYTSLASLIMFTGALWAVDEPLKNIIERLEPGVHDFWPLTITMGAKGDAYPKRFFGMVIGQFLQSFSPELSKPGSFTERNGRYRVFSSSRKFVTGLGFSKSVIANKHLWRERQLRSPQVLLSDALRNEIAAASLCVPKHYKMKEA
jgi:hypothetical protein